MYSFQTHIKRSSNENAMEAERTIKERKKQRRGRKTMEARRGLDGWGH